MFGFVFLGALGQTVVCGNYGDRPLPPGRAQAPAVVVVPAVAAAAAPVAVAAPVAAAVPAVAPAPVPAAAFVAKAPVKEAAVVAAAPAPAKPPAPAPIAPAAPGGGTCSARIDSVPSGASVRLKNRIVGATPLAALAVPCGDTTVTLVHKRYMAAEVSISASASTPAEVTARLERPPATLELTTTPAGATVRLNGRLAGKTPLSAPVARFETLRIDVEAPGQRPLRKSVYVKTASVKLALSLSGR
jgi:hypothetical protein